MAIFGNQSTNITNAFNVAGSMKELAIQQDNQSKIMSDTLNKFMAARDEMAQLQAQTGAILSSYSVDEKGKPDPTAPKYVHDLFNSVNKEGGIANLSRSQMIAGLQAYDTGTKVEQQRNALDIERIKVQQIKKAMQDQEAIEKATEEARKANLPKTKEGTEIKKSIENIGGQVVNLSASNKKKVSHIVARISEETSKPIESQDKEKLNNLMSQAWNVLHPLTNAGTKYIPSSLPANFESLSEEEQQKALREAKQIENPDYSETLNPYEKYKTLTKEDYAKLQSAESFKAPIEDFINSEVEKYNTAKEGSLNKEQKQLEVEIAKEQLNQANYWAGKPSTYESDIREVSREKQISNRIVDIDSKLEAAENVLKNKKYTRYGQYGGDIAYIGNFSENRALLEGGLGGYLKLTPKEENNLKKIILDLKNEKQTLLQEEQAKISKLESTIKTSTKQLQPYEVGQFKADSGDRWVEREEEVKVELKKTMDEQINDQYELAKNWMMQTYGRVPASFTKQSYAASQGIVVPTVIDTGAGYSYVQVGGVEKLVENKGDGTQNMMSIMDQKRLSDAANLGKAKDLNGLNANGFTFSGEINVNDINMANKVRSEIFTNTRTLKDVDTLISIAENATALEKALPTELSGYALQIQNSIQAAKRTEIGGSGAWSEQDQIRIDKIIADPTSLKSIVFRQQVLGSLKGFRDRLVAALKDQGTTYGFKFTSGNSINESKSAFRAAYASFLSRGYSKQQALQAAMPYLNGNTQ